MRELSLMTAFIAVLVLTGPGSALAEKTVFVSSPEYEITIQLSYTREPARKVSRVVSRATPRPAGSRT